MRSVHLIPTMILCAGLTLTAGCSEAPSEQEAASVDMAAESVAVSDASRAEAGGAGEAPGMTTSAAPGVAFAYSYMFSLPGKAISDVQHRHAAACEELGAQRCQITGMDFRQETSGSISARLDFLVAPDVAHRFGKQALDAVRAADGELTNAGVTGDNVGGEIDASQVRSAGLEAELARIEKRLATAGLSAQEHSALLARADELRGNLRHEADSRTEGEKRLATTPMSFAYASKGLFASSEDPLGNAASSSLDSMEQMLAVLLTLAGLLLPWILLAGLLFLAWKGLRRSAPSAAVSDSGGPPA
ncbi:MAG: hypothetical protein KDE25_05550 [Novosphingobium sp.]|nr:hypothetical protein [Novosphingobium sp.]